MTGTTHPDELVIAVVPPGRFPTVIRDLGRWRDAVGARRRLRLVRTSLNAVFWEQRVRDLGGSATLAQVERLRTVETYGSAATYLDAVRPLATALGQSKAAGWGYDLTLGRGPFVRSLDYRSAAALVDYSSRETVLRAHVDEATETLELSNAPLVMLAATSPEDLLTGLMIADSIHRVRPRAHVCLAEHGYENFSLHRHFARYGRASPLLQIFDSTLPSSETQRDDAERLLDSVYPSRGSSDPRDHNGSQMVDIALRPTSDHQTFAPPILWTRLDIGTCYWGRCTFCVQNDKASNRKSALATSSVRAVERVDELLAAKARFAIFSDEAIHPMLLGRISDRLNGEFLNWCGRIKIDDRIGIDVLERVAAAGGVELLVGLESAVPRIQQLMDKYDEQQVTTARRFLHHLSDAKVAIHLNLIAGFPSERPAEFMATWQLARDVLAEAHVPTFSLNPFTLFAGSPMAARPSVFGLRTVEPNGDLLVDLRYRMGRSNSRRAHAIRGLVDACAKDLDAVIGLPDHDRDPVLGVAAELFMATGHGLVLKANRIGGHALTEAATVTAG